MKRFKIASAILVVVLIASGCSGNPHIRNAETRGFAWGVVGTVLVGSLLYSIFSYRQQAAVASNRYVPNDLPIGATVVACPNNVRAPCWILPDHGQSVPAHARVVGQKRVLTGWETRISNDCNPGFKSPNPLPIPKRGEKVVVTCVPE